MWMSDFPILLLSVLYARNDVGPGAGDIENRRAAKTTAKRVTQSRREVHRKIACGKTTGQANVLLWPLRPVGNRSDIPLTGYDYIPESFGD